MSPILTYVVSVVLVLLGSRLVWQAIRERQLPEGLLGLFLIAGFGGAGTAMYGLECHRGGDPAGWTIVTVALAFANTGFVAYCMFVRRTFRSESRLAAAAVVLFAAASLGGWYLVALTQTFGEQSTPHPVAFVPRLAAMAWAAGESALAYRAHRRRLAIGLADVVVVNRFLLFTLWNLLLVSAPVTNAILRRLDPEAAVPVFAVLVWVIGTGLGVLTVLVFFPPARYLDWLRRGSEPVGGST